MGCPWQSIISVVWVGLTCVLNGCLVCIGPGMAVDFGFTK